MNRRKRIWRRLLLGIEIFVPPLGWRHGLLTAARSAVPPGPEAYRRDVDPIEQRARGMQLGRITPVNNQSRPPEVPHFGPNFTWGPPPCIAQSRAGQQSAPQGAPQDPITVARSVTSDMVGVLLEDIAGWITAAKAISLVLRAEGLVSLADLLEARISQDEETLTLMAEDPQWAASIARGAGRSATSHG